MQTIWQNSYVIFFIFAWQLLWKCLVIDISSEIGKLEIKKTLFSVYENPQWSCAERNIVLHSKIAEHKSEIIFLCTKF